MLYSVIIRLVITTVLFVTSLCFVLVTLFSAVNQYKCRFYVFRHPQAFLEEAVRPGAMPCPTPPLKSSRWLRELGQIVHRASDGSSNDPAGTG